MPHALHSPDKTPAAAVSLIWRGHSGRRYGMTEQELADFSLADGALYLLADGARALWVGTAEDLIGDAGSRTRFRQALAGCTAVYRCAEDLDPPECLSAALDLEHGTPVLYDKAS